MIIVAALYCFQKVENEKTMALLFKEFCTKQKIKGTLIFAKEGINGTIAGTKESIALFKSLFEKYFKTGEYKESTSPKMPFYRLKILCKKEIVTLGVEGIDPNTQKGTYLSPVEWNKKIQEEDVFLIDTRNHYETGIGTFKNAIIPDTNSFVEFVEYVQKNFDPKKHKKIAMCCTGGVRCEKSTSLMKKFGFKEVYHLKGGILNYLKEIPKEESLWQGECFVFDQRTSLTHGLEQGSYDTCHGCRMPISKTDRESKLYQKGVSCPHCFDQTSPEDKKRFLDRQKQVELSKDKNESHIGPRSV